MKAPARSGFIIRAIYAICLLGATFNHASQLIEHGLFWDYGGVPKFTAIFWTSLTFADPAAALLLFLRPRGGVMLTTAIIVCDVAHNTWIGFRTASFRQALSQSAHNLPYVEQIAFMIFVLATARFANQRKEEVVNNGENG